LSTISPSPSLPSTHAGSGATIFTLLQNIHDRSLQFTRH
jgi:hypothetical protein